MTKIETPNGEIDLGELCLKTDTINGKPIMRMKDIHQGPNYKLLIGMTAAILALGIMVPACNKHLENILPRNNVPCAEIQKTPTAAYSAGAKNIHYR